MVRKKIDLANKDLRQLGQNYQKKVWYIHTYIHVLNFCRRKNLKFIFCWIVFIPLESNFYYSALVVIEIGERV
jgi:hypothetical protein